jgi:hypothetical protein
VRSCSAASDPETADRQASIHDQRERRVNTYAIRRERAWESPADLDRTAERSKEVAESDFPDDIAWIRSYVIRRRAARWGRSQAA